MNIFDSILQSSTDKFLWKQTPQQPDISQTPQAPRTQNYTHPIQNPINKTIQPSTQSSHSILFADEKNAHDKMLSDGLPIQEVDSIIKKRRESLSPWLQLSWLEQSAFKQMASDGLSTEEALQILQKGRQMQSDKTNSDNATAEKNMWTGEKIAKNVVGAGLGAVSTIWSSAENILWWGANQLGFTDLGSSLQKEAQDWKTASTDLWNTPWYGAGVNAGNIIGGAGAMLAVPWPTGLLGEWAGLGAKILAGAGEWAIQNVGMWIADKWTTSVWEAIQGGLVGGTLPLVWAGLSKVKKLVTDKIPKSIISSGLMTPSKLLNASERLSRLSDEWLIKADEAPKWLLDKGIKWSKQTIQTQLTDIAKNATKQKVQLFANDLENWVAKTYGWHQAVKDLQQAMTEVLPNFAKVTEKSIIPKAGNAQKGNDLLEFITKPNPTALDIDKARAVLWDMWIFTKWWELEDTATKEWLQNVWVNASKMLDETLPWFRNLNKDIEVAHAMKKAIWLKEAQGSVGQLMTYTNVSLGGLGASYWYAKEWDVAGALKYWAAWLTGKYLLNNPAVTTAIAQKLKNLWSWKLLQWTAKIIKNPSSQKLIRWETLKITDKLTKK